MSRSNDDFADLPAESAKTNRDYQPEAADAAKPDPAAHPNAQPEGINGGSLQSPAFLTSLVKWHPAIGGFQFLADCFYGMKGEQVLPPHERFERTYERFRKLFWICIVVDILVMIAVLVGLGVVATRIAYITLFE